MIVIINSYHNLTVNDLILLEAFLKAFLIIMAYSFCRKTKLNYNENSFTTLLSLLEQTNWKFPINSIEIAKKKKIVLKT